MIMNIKQRKIQIEPKTKLNYNSYNANRWIECEARQRGIHIHHQLCGHGGERLVAGAYVGERAKPCFNIMAATFTGAPVLSRRVLKQSALHRPQRQPDPKSPCYQRTLARSQTLRNCGYTVVERWEHEDDDEYDPCL